LMNIRDDHGSTAHNKISSLELPRTSLSLSFVGQDY
jgi:hypothetical protein